MRKVELRMNEEYKYKIIKKLVETNGDKQRAAVKLKRSIRQINRMIAGYKEFGKEFFVHGNRGRKPKNALTEEFKTEIELLYTNKYFDCTYTKFKEFLETRENINLSIDEVRVILRDKYIFSPRTHKSTKRKFRKKLENEIKTAKKKEQEQLMLILDNLGAYILEKSFKWMLVYILGIIKKKLLFMRLLMTLQDKLLVYILINKKL